MTHPSGGEASHCGPTLRGEGPDTHIPHNTDAVKELFGCLSVATFRLPVPVTLLKVGPAVSHVGPSKLRSVMLFRFPFPTTTNGPRILFPQRSTN